MANFKIAYQKTMGHEGGYVSDPDDRGGETYCGISRRWHPGWPGWSIVDAHKESPGFPGCLKDISELPEMVKDFYRSEFWDKVAGGEMFSQRIADELFDTAVNMSPKDAGKFLQRSLNCLNRNASLYPDLVIDGSIGPATLRVMSGIDQDDAELLYGMMNVLQGMHYIEEMESDNTQEKYCRGWFKRVNIKKLSADTVRL